MTIDNRLTRRQFGQLAIAAVPASLLLPELGFAKATAEPITQARINSRINGVQIGAITYSLRSIPDANEVIKAYVTIGLGEMEIMSNHVEALAGAPSGRGGGGGGRNATLTPEQQAARDEAAKALTTFRTSATEATFKPVREKIRDAGIELRLLCYNMNVRSTQDDEIEYAFVMAKGLGVQTISTSTQVSMAKRLAPFAEKHKIMVGFHGHSSINAPDEVAKPESFVAVMAESKYHGANLDIGHYTAAGYDPIPFITEHHARITNLHLKDRKNLANGGANLPWGQGDTPIKDVLKLLQKNKWDLPANIEFEYPGDPMVELPKCLQFCKDALA